MVDQETKRKLIEAALDHAQAMTCHAFSIPVPGTSPQLYVSLHEGPVAGVQDMLVAANEPLED